MSIVYATEAQLLNCTLRAVMWQGSLTWEWTRSTMGEVGTRDMSVEGNYQKTNYLAGLGVDEYNGSVALLDNNERILQKCFSLGDRSI